ncbi:iron uptake system protein EfeO [Aciduricibacillus chroicocephali]|uniref:Iron uptake system protein EfeO n=1 Tax=Aciduricibacillus chroicocephali TaxID=3054939 RepID=A0ABY9L138_9BACI|nr:iron uptake system protein EfeO [Bacillaceae bacterium 44XB]
MNKNIKILSILTLTGTLLFGCTQENEKNNQSKEKEEAQSGMSAKEQKRIVTEYREYAINELDQFVEKTTAFTDAVKAGDVEKAKKLYAPARMHYERSEPIAESFADLDPKIDAREGDVPKEDWTGYHRIEKGLWVDNSADGVKDYADQLKKDVHVLRSKVETVDITADVLVTGAVDLLNEVSTSKITGEEDRYSHTDLYDFVANVDGAKEIFKLFKPTVEKKDEKLAKTIDKRFDNLYGLLEKHKDGDGYVSYTKLKKDEVQELSRAVNELAEPLSQIGIALEG